MSDDKPQCDPRYPFGALTVPWYVAGLFLGIWAFGSQYVYHFSFVADKYDLGRGHVGVQDFAGYVGFFFVGIFGIIACIALGLTHKRTFRMGLPNPRDLVKPFVVSSLVFAFPYVAVSVFYGEHRYALPYDGAWAAISGICSVGFVHFAVFSALAICSQPIAQPDGENAAG